MGVWLCYSVRERSILVQIPFTLPELLSRHLAVRTGGIFYDPVLLVDGKPAPQGKDGAFSVVSEEGGPVIIRLQGRSFIDPVPDVLVSAAGEERTVVLLPPMRGWEYLWCLLPLIVLLVFVRSPISGLLGALVTYINVMVLYKAPNRSAGIARAGLVSVLVLAAYFGITYLLLAPFRSHVGAAPAPTVSASPSR